MIDIFCSSVLVVAIVYGFFLIVKATVAAKAHKKILDAIDEYSVYTNDYAFCIEMLDAMENLNSTLFRFWDWGYTNILPERYFELIKPYID